MNTLWVWLSDLARTLTVPPLRALGGFLAGLALPCARGAAGVSMIVAAVALAHDLGPATLGRQQGSAGFSPQSVMRHWEQLAPQSLTATRTAVTHLLPHWVWGLVASVLALPAFVVFAGLAVAFGYLGRRRRRVEIFAN